MKLNNVTPEEWDEAFKRDNARKKRELDKAFEDLIDKWEKKVKQAKNKPKKPMTNNTFYKL